MVRYLGRFREVNVFRPPRRYIAKIALVFPSTYEASITNLFTHIAYYYLNEQADVLVDRFTLDNPTEGALTGLSLRSFDIILASISFELDLPLLVRILDMNGIKLEYMKRSEGPLIIIGGIVPTANPIPYSVIADAVFVGDGEKLLEVLKDSITLISSDSTWKKNFIEYLASKTEGVYSKCLSHNTVKKGIIGNLDNAYIPKYLIRSLDREPIYGDGYYIEIMRGCPWLCPFCLESHASYPLRFRSLDIVLKSIYEGLNNLNVRRVVFFSLSFFDYPYADKLLDKLGSEGISYSVPSLRYTTLNEDRIKKIIHGGQKTVTIAPETTGKRCSCLIGKCYDEGLVLDIARYVIRLGANLKLYFMLGLPCEVEDDIKSIADLINKIIELTRPEKPEQIRVTINPFIPKPNTPMQYFGLVRENVYKHRVNTLLNHLKYRKYVRIDIYKWRLAFAQALIGLGGEEAGRLAINWGLGGGDLGSLRRVLRELHYNIDYVFTNKDLDYEFPWSIVKLGIEDRFRSIASSLMPK